MKNLLDVLIDIASTPAILVAFIAVLGLLLQKKGIADIIRGGIKTFVGFLVVTAGANFVVSSLEPFGAMFQKAFNVTGVVPNKGDDLMAIDQAINFLKIQQDVAVAIILDSVKAQGVPFFEELMDNHAVKFNTESYQHALQAAIDTLTECVRKEVRHV